MKTIFVIGDGSTNLKFQVYDAENFQLLHSRSISTPKKLIDDKPYMDFTTEMRWYDECMYEVPSEYKISSVISPSVRGVTAALVDSKNRIIDT